MNARAESAVVGDADVRASGGARASRRPRSTHTAAAATPVANKAPSLRGALTRRLVVGLFAIGLVGSAAAYIVGTHFATRAYDRVLFDVVQTLAKQLRWTDGHMDVALSPEVIPWLLTDEGEDVTYRVTDVSNDRVLAANGDLGPLPDLSIADGEPNFRSVVIANENLRVAYVKEQVGPGNAVALVEIGETLRKRERISRAILVATLTMMSLIGLAAVALVWSGIAKALAPLDALEADVARRSVGDLQSLDPGRAPIEVHALIEAINHMIGRVAESVDLQRQFLANAAHQLKTPIAGVRLQAQLALKADPGGTARDSMREVERRATHSAHLIEQLLTLARAEATDDVLPAVPCALADIVAEVIERRLSDAIARRIDLGFDGDGSPGIIVANPVLVGELVGNLVDNSLRYGRDGGRVTVTLAHGDGFVDLAVSDDGDGLSADQRENAFRRFWRSDASSGDGAGLGLAIVKEIAERYRGTVTIDSRPAFDGTRVTVRFDVRSPGTATPNGSTAGWPGAPANDAGTAAGPSGRFAVSSGAAGRRSGGAA